MARWTEASWPQRPDPFATSPEVPTGLAAGWLVDAPAHGAAAASSPARSIRTSTPPTPWRALGAGWRRFERRAAARLGVVPYPLADSLLLRGMTPAEMRRLARRFHADTAVESWEAPQAALAHLATLLPTWSVREWTDVRGLQVFLGPAGSGKTTLLCRVARQLHARGTKVAAVTLCTAPAPRAAFAALARQIGIAAFCAPDAPALERILALPAAAGVVLVDTPCSAGETRALQAFLGHPLLRHPRTVLHLCLSLQHGSASHEATLRFGAAQRADCVAVAHADLAAGAGCLVALLLGATARFSFAGASTDPTAAPLPFGAAPFLEALRRGD